MAALPESKTGFLKLIKKIRQLARKLRQPFAPQRSQYKATWKGLSKSLKKATEHVIGDVPEEQINSSADETLAILKNTVGIKREDTVLEIGCGIGRVGRVVAPCCRQWVGCDVSPNMLKHAQERLSGLKNVKLTEISGYDLSPIASDSVDMVYCTVVFMHLDEWDRYSYTLEALRVLRSGGRFYADNFNLCSDGGFEFFEQIRKEFSRFRPPHISKSSTPQELETYLKRAGFLDVRIQTEGTWVRCYGVKKT